MVKKSVCTKFTVKMHIYFMTLSCDYSLDVVSLPDKKSKILSVGKSTKSSDKFDSELQKCTYIYRFRSS